MPSITITKEDLLRGKILEAGWYHAEVKEIVEEVSKSGNSTNQVVDFIIIAGPATGVPLRTWLNDSPTSKGLAFVPYLLAFGVDLNDKTIGSGKTFDTDATKGKKLDIYVQPSSYEGRAVNQIKDFRKYSG